MEERMRNYMQSVGYWAKHYRRTILRGPFRYMFTTFHHVHCHICSIVYLLKSGVLHNVIGKENN